MRRTAQLQIRVTPLEKKRLKAAAAAAGEDLSSWVLRRLLPPAGEQFLRLWQTAVRSASTGPALAAIHDLLAVATAEQLAALPRPSLESDPWLAAYVAAMVETAAQGVGARPPDWTADALPLPRPWFASTLRSLRVHLLRASPPAFRSRHLFIDTTIGGRV
jgi:hypothetical protein